jgi:hypothetical protein
VKTETRMSVVQMCEVAGFSRAGYYRALDPVKPARGDMELRDRIQKIALEWPWHLDGGLDESLTLNALRMALRERSVQPGLVHHSDRGVQYACRARLRFTDNARIKLLPHPAKGLIIELQGVG